MVLTESEVDKLVCVLNHIIEERGYDVNKDGFSYDDDLNIFNFDESQTVDFESGLDFMIAELGIDYKSKSLNDMTPYAIANILYNMSLDMDYADYVEYFKDEINMLETEIEKLKANDSVLYHALENIALTNQNYYNLLTKGDMV